MIALVFMALIFLRQRAEPAVCLPELTPARSKLPEARSSTKRVHFAPELVEVVTVDRDAPPSALHSQLAALPEKSAAPAAMDRKSVRSTSPPPAADQRQQTQNSHYRQLLNPAGNGNITRSAMRSDNVRTISSGLDTAAMEQRFHLNHGFRN